MTERRGQPDKTAASRPRLARTGQALVEGAPSMAAAMRAGGYAPSTTRNPTQAGVTQSKALAAYAKLAVPRARTLIQKSRKVLHAALDSEDINPELKLHVAASVLKSAPEEVDDPNTVMHPVTSYTMARTDYNRRLAVWRWIKATLRNPARAAAIADSIFETLIPPVDPDSPGRPQHRPSRDLDPELYSDARKPGAVIDAEVLESGAGEQSVGDKQSAEQSVEGKG